MIATHYKVVDHCIIFQLSFPMKPLGNPAYPRPRGLVLGTLYISSETMVDVLISHSHLPFRNEMRQMCYNELYGYSTT
ncbi:MAG: hypothetical protein AAB513_00410 [Patescibacteria group bacterium]